jgi:hypothetical protein
MLKNSKEKPTPHPPLDQKRSKIRETRQKSTQLNARLEGATGSLYPHAKRRRLPPNEAVSNSRSLVQGLDKATRQRRLTPIRHMKSLL